MFGIKHNFFVVNGKVELRSTDSQLSQVFETREELMAFANDAEFVANTVFGLPEGYERFDGRPDTRTNVLSQRSVSINKAVAGQTVFITNETDAPLNVTSTRDNGL